MRTLVKTKPSPTFGRNVPYFLERVSIPDGSGCMVWRGPINAKGYGVIGCASAAGYSRAAHRFAYTYWVEVIPTGLTIDHLCRNRACVNPAHLEPVTQGENAHRRPRRTHCPQGHEYTPENTYVYVTNEPNRLRTRWQCATCHCERDRERYARRKGAA